MEKLQEFIILLEKSELDSQNVKGIKTRIDKVLDEKLEGKELIRNIREVSSASMNKLDQLDQLEILLANNHFDSANAKSNRFKLGMYKGIKIVIGFLFITLGFAMIIMPAPPYFEMFVIFNFNWDDGFTLMDLISLIIIAVGIYIIIKSVFNIKTDE